MKMTPLVLHCSAALLLLMLLYSPPILGSIDRSRICCLKKTTTMVRLDWLKEYKEQKKAVCPVHALIFTTKKNKNICSDPASPWAIKAKNYLDNKNRPPVKPKPSYHTTALKPSAQPQSNITAINGTSVSV